MNSEEIIEKIDGRISDSERNNQDSMQHLKNLIIQDYVNYGHVTNSTRTMAKELLSKMIDEVLL